MKISTPRGCLDLAVDASLQIEETSPVLNDRGSQSLPLTVPATPHNAAMLAFPQRIDRHDPLPSDLLCTIHDGAFVRQGRINVISASPTDGITVNIGFDNAEAYAKWLKMVKDDAEKEHQMGDVDDNQLREFLEKIQ